MYEASDLLLGDSLCSKSVTVQYINVSMPHKRNRRVKKHKDLEGLAKMQPDSEGIFLNNVIDTHYPCRPEKLESICLYDFVANYDWTKRDSKGNPKKLTKLAC